jgi:hypothetical protein
MRLVTALGDEDFYILVFPLLFWAVSQSVGTRLGVMLLLSAGLNEAGKIATRSPRPSFLVPDLGLVGETTTGMPSGHAQHGVVVWGLLAAESRRRLVWVGAFALVVLLGWSRLHLGLHFPADVLVGWLVGALLLVAYLRLRHPVGGWLVGRRPGTQVSLAFLASVGLVVLAVAARVAFLDWHPPTEWVGIDAQAWPVGVSHAVTPAGALFGIGAGVVLLRRRGGFEVTGPVWQRAVRCLVGLVGVVVLWQGLGAYFPSGEDVIALAYRYLRYALVGVWITGVAPLLFVRLSLAPAGERGAATDAEQPGTAVG